MVYKSSNRLHSKITAMLNNKWLNLQLQETLTWNLLKSAFALITLFSTVNIPMITNQSQLKTMYNWLKLATLCCSHRQATKQCSIPVALNWAETRLGCDSSNTINIWSYGFNKLAFSIHACIPSMILQKKRAVDKPVEIYCTNLLTLDRFHPMTIPLTLAIFARPVESKCHNTCNNQHNFTKISY